PVGSWYNVTILVKMDFKELQQVDPSLLNHMRLLHSLVTSALQPMACTVHHLHSAPGDASTTVSRLLLGLLRPLPVADVSALLGDIAKRVYEVISVQMSMSVSTRSSTPVLEGNCAQTWRAHTGASVTRKLQPRLHGS
ncbi:UMODL1 isoform 10, partial [Pongo abelii]